jgi:hypothetical protein
MRDVLGPRQAALHHRESGLHEHDQEAGQQSPHHVDGDAVVADRLGELDRERLSRLQQAEFIESFPVPEVFRPRRFKVRVGPVLVPFRLPGLRHEKVAGGILDGRRAPGGGSGGIVFHGSTRRRLRPFPILQGGEPRNGSSGLFLTSLSRRNLGNQPEPAHGDQGEPKIERVADLPTKPAGFVSPSLDDPVSRIPHACSPILVGCPQFKPPDNPRHKAAIPMPYGRARIELSQ